MSHVETQQMPNTSDASPKSSRDDLVRLACVAWLACVAIATLLWIALIVWLLATSGWSFF